ncbi:MAG: response regulator [Chitinophagaceae bacterium]|nr:response regulator [Chitinophagaceae bacterium]
MKDIVTGKYLLYADDDSDDIEMVTEIMKEIDPSLVLITFSNGLELVQFLKELPVNSFLPCFIILDMNMPQYDGLTTLKMLKSENNLAQIPVIMFSTSGETVDVNAATKLGASTYITKPVRSAELAKITLHFTEFCRELPVRKKEQNSSFL